MKSVVPQVFALAIVATMLLAVAVLTMFAERKSAPATTFIKTKCCAMDCENAMAVLLTATDFGCNQFQQRSKRS